VAWQAIFQGDFEPSEVEAYSELVQNLHRFQDRLASMRMDQPTIEKLSAEIAAWSDALAPLETEERHQVNGRLMQLPVRGHAMLPELRVSKREPGRVEGTVRFGRWFMGGGMAAHGGAVALLFDEVLGIQSGLAAEGMTRTAYLTTNYRAVTPIDVDLDVTAWVERIEGRKIFVRGELRQQGGLCAESEGLFLTLQPGSTGRRAVPVD